MVLDNFSASLGHKVSANKTLIFFLAMLTQVRLVVLARILVFRSLITLVSIWMFDCCMIESTKIFITTSWRKSTRSYLAEMLTSFFFIKHLTLAKFVFMTIPIYTIQTTTLPKVLCDQIEGVVKKFICG